MRPARGPSPHHAERVERPSGGAADRRSERPGERPERPSGGGERPASPKKRKATYNIDKEFILKDDKVKRNTGRSVGGCCLSAGYEWQAAGWACDAGRQAGS